MSFVFDFAFSYFFYSFLLFGRGERCLKMWRVELSWSSLNEHLINHPYNASVASLLVLFLLFPTCLSRVRLFRYLQKKKEEFKFFYLSFFLCFFLFHNDLVFFLFLFFLVGRLLMAIKISQKIRKKKSTFFFVVVPLQFFFSFSSYLPLFYSLSVISRSMVCDNG